MWYMHDVGWGWWLLMSLGMVAFWALVLYGVMWLVRGDALGRSPTSAPQSPHELLERRLAAGEITFDEYERVRRVLDGEPSETREPALR
jgi:putative membrane protein